MVIEWSDPGSPDYKSGLSLGHCVSQCLGESVFDLGDSIGRLLGFSFGDS